MSKSFVRFDSMLTCVVDTLKHPKPTSMKRIYVIRDLYGKVRLAVSEAHQDDEGARRWLNDQAKLLQQRLAARSFPPEDAVLFLDDALMEELHRDGRKILPSIFWIDRLLTGAGWWNVNSNPLDTPMYTLYSVKGGVGRSTTAAVLAWHLARKGQNVLVVDLDLESPGISSAMLDHSLQPEFGVVDWFVEDMVGQGDHVIEGMIAQPTWHQELPGDVRIVPAHGAEPGEYLAKLGRVYMDTDVRWTERLKNLLQKLGENIKPSLVLLESRSGLHDIAAATVTDLNAHVLLFAANSEANWQDYGILFEHWSKLGLANHIRRRLSIVSSLTPEIDTEKYMRRFRERSWDIFQEYLYDSLDSDDEPYGFAFELAEESAPHDPIPVHWTRGLAAGASLRNIEGTTVAQAYSVFLQRFDELLRMNKRDSQ